MSDTGLSDVLRPIETAHGLANAHYTDAGVFEAERARLMFGQWAGIGFAKDVPHPGDARPVDFLGMPLLILHGRDGRLRVFQNTCRHRGMILVEAPRRIEGVLRCPYHSWCYAHDGALVATPHVGGPGRNAAPGIERGELGLVEIPSHVWRDVIFVNVDGQAPAFGTHAARAIARWGDFEGQALHSGGADSGFGFDLACNWKLAVENFCESYHLPWVHPGLNSYSRLEDHYHIEEPGEFSGQGTLVYRPMITPEGRRFPDFEGLGPAWQTGAEYIALYPNVLFGVHRDHAFAMVLTPRGVDRTEERVELYYASEAVTGPDWAAMREKNAAMWREVLEEDIFVVEGMQRGRRAVHFDGGRFSPAMDGPTHMFHRWVAERMAGAA